MLYCRPSIWTLVYKRDEIKAAHRYSEECDASLQRVTICCYLIVLFSRFPRCQGYAYTLKSPNFLDKSLAGNLWRTIQHTTCYIIAEDRIIITIGQRIAFCRYSRRFKNRYRKPHFCIFLSRSICLRQLDISEIAYLWAACQVFNCRNLDSHYFTTCSCEIFFIILLF